MYRPRLVAALDEPSRTRERADHARTATTSRPPRRRNSARARRGWGMWTTSLTCGPPWRSPGIVSRGPPRATYVVVRSEVLRIRSRHLSTWSYGVSNPTIVGCTSCHPPRGIKTPTGSRSPRATGSRGRSARNGPRSNQNLGSASCAGGRGAARPSTASSDGA